MSKIGLYDLVNFATLESKKIVLFFDRQPGLSPSRHITF
jgi:hypothetical protein